MAGKSELQKSLSFRLNLSKEDERELYEAIDVVRDNLNFMASVPADMGKMLDKKGFYKEQPLCQKRGN